MNLRYMKGVKVVGFYLTILLINLKKSRVLHVLRYNVTIIFKYILITKNNEKINGFFIIFIILII